MRVSILQQPFNSRGELSCLGVALSDQLVSGDYDRVHIFSAFVTSSGTQRLGPAFQAVTQAGGTVSAMIGVNNGLTSVQAVTDLQAAGAEVLGFHTGGSILYHPKVYLLRGANRAWISVGSSNLTGDGMFRNVETNTILELDLALGDDIELLEDTWEWFEHLRNTYPRNAIRLTQAAALILVESGALIDEIERARQTRPANVSGRRAARPQMPPRLAVPVLPPAGGQRPVRRRRPQGVGVQEENSAAAPSMQTRFFAMILSAHDASKKTGMPGTPELSLPRPARDFFPPMRMAGRQYPDAYFDARLNQGNHASTVTYRIWERPAGGGAGHADLRINIKHETVDLTTDGGGDIILFEVSPDAEGPAYEVWIMRNTDANYVPLSERCTHRVAAQGAAEAKRYGFF